MNVKEQQVARPCWRKCLFVVGTVMEKVTCLAVELAGLQLWSALVP